MEPRSFRESQIGCGDVLLRHARILGLLFRYKYDIKFVGLQYSETRNKLLRNQFKGICISSISEDVYFIFPLKHHKENKRSLLAD